MASVPWMVMETGGPPPNGDLDLGSEHIGEANSEIGSVLTTACAGAFRLRTERVLLAEVSNHE